MSKCKLSHLSKCEQVRVESVEQVQASQLSKCEQVQVESVEQV